jgi:hypothetical protein
LNEKSVKIDDMLVQRLHRPNDQKSKAVSFRSVQFTFAKPICIACNNAAAPEVIAIESRALASVSECF